MPLFIGKRIRNSIRSIAERTSSMSLGFIVYASSAAFITYLSMYAFRKPFTAATYGSLKVWGVDYKIMLIFFQLAGYTVSKYLGIKFISEIHGPRRIWALCLLMLTAWLALFFFAIIPPPINAFCMFLNGLPLGLIWGLVFGYLEGRRSTEVLGAVMASSFILSSGITKSAGSYLLSEFEVSEMWMPFMTGLLFIPLLAAGLSMLNSLLAPDEEDMILRTERIPMRQDDRKVFFLTFAPGILISIIVYVGLTMFRDLRDNFAVEFWTASGHAGKPGLLMITEIPISITVLIIISLLIMMRDNRIAFYTNFLIMFAGGFILIVSTVSFSFGLMGPVFWMIVSGFSMYLPYMAYHTLYFERWIACFRVRSNAGYLMYMMDSAGYMGSMVVLLLKNFMVPDLSWMDFFIIVSMILGVVLVISSWTAFRYFRRLHYSLINEAHS
jgi:hypothetical protein